MQGNEEYTISSVKSKQWNTDFCVLGAQWESKKILPERNLSFTLRFQCLSSLPLMIRIFKEMEISLCNN